MSSDNPEKKKHVQAVDVPGWPRPKGYANGTITEGRLLHVAGQIGWKDGKFEHRELAGQFGQALENVVAIVRAAGGAPEHIARMTVYVTDLDAYRSNLAGVGEAWRKHLGKHFPAMALLGVAGLVEREAIVEIEAVAALDPLPEGTRS
jgi:enamine deaminase RidA (YjgF/YER057c/UK114 family)